MSTTNPNLLLDRENPWPGLLWFPESGRSFFNGRDIEQDELYRRIRRETLTLLYGRSGLGKSSLLLAGLFPLLRQENFLPVHLRLIHEVRPETHTAWMQREILKAAVEAGIDAPPPTDGESLWEYLQREGNTFKTADGRRVIPVLVIDQFEEIFTVGGEDSARRTRSAEFLTELGDLIDNRPSDALLARIDEDPEIGADYELDRSHYKIVLGLREDYFPELKSRLRAYTRSKVDNWLRLEPMTGAQALEAVLKTGGSLVDDDVAMTIVRFLDDDPDDSRPLEEVQVEPALLSVVCRELNERRKAKGKEKISTELLDPQDRDGVSAAPRLAAFFGAMQNVDLPADSAQNRLDQIISDFYHERFRGVHPALRRFVEEKLLTESGFRDSAALDDALRQPGISQSQIDKLVDERIIRLEERSGAKRMELTHDVLTRIARDSRDRRRREEGRKQFRKQLLLGAGMVLLLLGAAGVAAYYIAVAAVRTAEAALIVAEANEREEQALEEARRIADRAKAEADSIVQRADSVATAAVTRAGLSESQRLVAQEVSDLYLSTGAALVRRSVAQERALTENLAQHIEDQTAAQDSLLGMTLRLRQDSIAGATLRGALAGVFCRPRTTESQNLGGPARNADGAQLLSFQRELADSVRQRARQQEVDSLAVAARERRWMTDSGCKAPEQG